MRVLRGSEESAERGFDSECVEVITSDQIAEDTMRAGVVVQRHLRDPISEQRFKYGIAVPNVAIVREGLAGVA